MRLLPAILVFAIVLGGSLIGCRHELILPPAPDVTDTSGQDTIPVLPVDSADYSGVPCSPDTVYFQNQVLPLLVSGCAKTGCHNTASHKEGIILVDYATVMSDNLVKAGNPSGSKLYKVMVTTDLGDRMPPPPDAAFTTDQKALIYKWIQQGAKNNVCNESWGGCDTTGVTYANFIYPLMANKCNGCHAGSSASGGIKLTTYTEVRNEALNGRLYGSIAWLSGYKAMPDGGAQLSNCYQNKVQAWINAGMPQ
jgi:hypothetical protein